MLRPFIMSSLMNSKPVKAVVSSPSGIIADMWQDFEMSSLTPTNLAARSHCATGTWTILDATGEISMSTIASHPMISQVNGTTDTGTSSILIMGTANAQACVAYAFPSPVSNISFGYWYRFPAGVTSTLNQQFNFSLGSGSALISVSARASSGVPYFYISGLSTLSVAPIKFGNWYWITGNYAGTGAITASIYDNTGSLIYTGSLAGVAGTVDGIRIGRYNGSSAVAASASIDNVMLNWTTLQYPLGP